MGQTHPILRGRGTASSKILGPYWGPVAAKFGMVTHVGRTCFSGVRNTPYIKGGAFPTYFIGNTDARSVWPRATKFGMITRGIGVCFSSDQWRPVLKRRGPAYQKILRTYMRAQNIRNSNHILQGDQTTQYTRRNLLHDRPRRLPRPNNFATRMLTRDLFARTSFSST